jgi:hypothetical protein
MAATHTIKADCFTSRSEAADISSAATPAEQLCPLSGDALRLMSRLQDKVSMDKLADQYPRILNRIAILWDKPLLADRYFEELLLDNRGSRQGFTLAVLSEINLLRDYYVTVAYPKRVDPWEQMLYV